VKWGYRIEEEAKRDLKKLGPQAARKVVDYLDKRIKGASDPRAHGKPLRGDKHGLWRYRVEDYRILARIEDALVVVTVVAVGHRRDVYR
jgi:mRNA interferase RelE/StbE